MDKVEDLGLKKRTIGALRYANILTLPALLTRNAKELVGIYGLGKVGVKEIEKVLHARGLQLRPSPLRKPAIPSKQSIDRTLSDLQERVKRLEFLLKDAQRPKPSFKEPELPFRESNH